MCTHVNTSEFVPALVSEIAEKKVKKGGSETFRIPESVLWKVAKEIEDKCWVNIMLSRPSLDNLVESMSRHKTYGPSFIKYEIAKKNRPLVLHGVDKKRRTAMSNYYFDNEEKWYGVLDNIVDKQVSVAENGLVSVNNKHQ